MRATEGLVWLQPSNGESNRDNPLGREVARCFPQAAKGRQARPKGFRSKRRKEQTRGLAGEYREGNQGEGGWGTANLEQRDRTQESSISGETDRVQENLTSLSTITRFGRGLSPHGCASTGPCPGSIQSLL